jgi:hypothetical protein
MLGRVSSLDWLISIGLLPLSFALTAPVTEMIGAQMTLVGAGVGGAVITFAGLFLPGMRDVEREEPVAEPEAPADLAVDVVIVATVLHKAPPVAAARRMHP